jgi:hypothetical protein
MKIKGEDISSEKINKEIEDELLELTVYVPFFKRDPIENNYLKNNLIKKNYILEKNDNSKNVIESPSAFIMEALAVKQKRDALIFPVVSDEDLKVPLHRFHFIFTFFYNFIIT